MSEFDRLPPHNIEAEEAVLGSLLIDPQAIYEVVGFLKPEAFYRETHRWLYSAVLALHDLRQPADFVTITDILRQRGQWESVGGESFLIDLINAVPTAINASSYGHIVEGDAIRRNLLKAASTIANLAYNTEEAVDIVLDRAEEALFSISEQRAVRDLTPVSSIARDVLANIERLREQGDEIIGIPTGFYDVDRLLGGLNKSDLIIVAARPGMGKTSLMLSMMLAAARQYRKRVAMFSLEMSSEQLLLRLLSADTEIDSQRLRRGQLQEHEMGLFYESIGRLSEAQIYIDDTPALSPRDMRTKCRRLYAEKGIDLVLVDYLQLMQSERPSNNRVQEISDISRGLKLLARELNAPVVAASQLSRAVEGRQDKRPMLSDLRESGSIEQDADIVAFIYRDDYYNKESDRPNVAELTIAKHRNGPTGTIDLFWKKELATFRNLNRQEVDLNR